MDKWGIQTAPQRDITQKEYDDLVELADSIITKNKEIDILDIQRDLDKKGIDFVFFRLYFDMNKAYEKSKEEYYYIPK